ncbi:hypothetical protein BH747_00115 [Enterococcus villorum]|uniref:UPF0223 protein n=2 Tax=Enterococcus villorum TaxID=112904 RepID=A0A1V8YLP1_9ENTE|nr:UPF0223 family protein [Enterococcus villorum]EOH89962.1 hypothetical protein UAO_01206 [Enterococcus villorum ATCC 700913]EOW78194.1 hypothetical protein I591_01049 [Enterococcus villorum ATCC 700913]OQO71274.1 hypothetical protein BH747_00115 [Enterococcus villorum]OQO73541.1 hypothetical protein BH744_10035 [Enterococcus villorum]GEL90907.1 UPF0223 protein [Enterococcus villorum]
MQDYQYPLDLDWTTQEMVIVMKMWEDLETANEKGIDNAKFLKTYQAFKTVIKSIGEEKRLGREFEKVSGYSLYRTVQEAKKNPKKILKMNG